ncbi:TolC family protein [Rubrivirga sp. IMCC43871]|uniref:TolC family protein n=1 Tax=Rubrivirga sp. IMCC43871 TaxID=3391575 RepID=UPI00398F9517
MTLLLALLFLGAPADSLDLATARAVAEAQDPRVVQPVLTERATALRLEAIRLGRLPQLAFSGQASVQSAVPTIPVVLPDGTTPSAPKEQARIQAEADWAVLDGGRAERQADVVRAQAAEQSAGARVALYSLREATTEAFFGALLLSSQAETLGLAVEDLSARLAVLRARAAQGAALSAHADALEADLLGLRQQVAEAHAGRAAALAVLADLTGLALGPDAVLVTPDLGETAALLRQQGALVDDDELDDALDTAERPEFARFAATVHRAEAEARLARAATAPVVSLFGQAGVGRPSPFDFLSDTAREYAIAGVRLRWAPVDWGRSRREAEAARVTADLARTEADAFARQLRRATIDDVVEIDRLTDALALDARIVALRQEALRVAGRQLDEGVLLPDAYTDRVTDLAAARLAEARHRIERSRAQARALSNLGLFPEGAAPPVTDPDALDR